MASKAEISAAVLAVKVNERRLTRGLQEVRKRMPHLAGKLTRALGLAVVSEITRSMNGEEAGYPLPKRIDTGRLRAAWNVGIERGTGVRVPQLPVTPTKNNRPQANDGEGSFTGSGMTAHLRVRNNVRYAQYVEYGTKHMAPGGHLARALHVVGERRNRIARAILRDSLK